MTIQVNKILLFLLLFNAAAGFAENRVKTGDFTKTIILNGSLKAQEAERFAVPVTDSWEIQIKWMVKEGSEVKPGDPVVRFDTSNLATEIENLERSLEVKLEEKKQKTANYNHEQFELQVKTKQAEIDYKKMQIDASIPKGIEANYEYDRKQLELKKKIQALDNARMEKQVKLTALDTELKKLEIEIREARGKLEKTRDLLKSMTLSTNTAGTILYGRHWWQDRKIQVGDTVASSWTAAYIPDNESLQVEAWVNESDIQQVQPGQKVNLILDAYPGRQFTGTVKDVFKSAEDKRYWGRSHYFRTGIDLDRRDPSIMKPGMSVMCRVTVARCENVLLIPLEMVKVDTGESYSFRVKPMGKKELAIQPLGWNEFFAAVAPDHQSPIKNGVVLQRITAEQ